MDSFTRTDWFETVQVLFARNGLPLPYLKEEEMRFAIAVHMI